MNDERAEARSAADRYRRATFVLAQAAKAVDAATADVVVSRTAVVQQARDDLDHALQVLAAMPQVKVQGDRRKPAKHVERAMAGPAVKG